MPVQQHVLNWLYSVLTSEYHDVNRTYNDVAHALTRYPTLSPRTDVHTFANGTSALLLHLSGTVPVNFRGQTYRFPVSIWVPHVYPREPPLIYVTPTETMMIRPGQHLDPQGQVYHPYLVGWAEFWDKSSLHDFLAILCDVFAKEPPVIARQQQRQSPSPHTPQTPPQIPPTPQDEIRRHPSHGQPQPPRLPPKTSPHAHQQTSSPPVNQERGPPLPPLPPNPNAASRASRYDSAPPLPQEAQGRTQGGHPATYHSPTPPHVQRPLDHVNSQMAAGSAANIAPRSQVHTYQGHPDAHVHHPTEYPIHPPQTSQQPWAGSAHPPQRQTVPPPPDLLDEPLTLELPDRSGVAPPPIPPNPEKDALLRQLAQTLASLRQRSRQQNESSMAGLQAQRNAILGTLPILQSEMGQLTQLSNILTSNTAILHDALHKADGVIEGSRSHPAPDTDDLLVAPTVVGNQLYTLVAEERALGDAIFMLGRAVERGRISPAVFAKMTRSLAREWYLKKALVRKIGLGMGLA